MLRMPEFRQLLMGISTSRYLPPSGTAGLALSFVRGKSLVPAPPPIIMARVRSSGEDQGKVTHKGSSSCPRFSELSRFPRELNTMTRWQRFADEEDLRRGA